MRDRNWLPIQIVEYIPSRTDQAKESHETLSWTEALREPEPPKFDSTTAKQPEEVSAEDKAIAFSPVLTPPPEFTKSLLGEDQALPPDLSPKSYDVPGHATIPNEEEYKPSKAMIPLESVGKMAGAVMDWSSSGKGFIEQALALTPAAPAVMLKWATDMVKSGKESIESIGDRIKEVIRSAISDKYISANKIGAPQELTPEKLDEHIQGFSDDIVNVLGSGLGAYGAAHGAIKSARAILPRAAEAASESLKAEVPESVAQEASAPEPVAEPVTPQAIADFQEQAKQELPQAIPIPEVPNASSIQETGTVHGDVPAQPIESPVEVPIQEGGERVQPPQAAQAEVPLDKPQPQPATKEEIVGMGGAIPSEFTEGANPDVFGIRQETRESMAKAGTAPDIKPGEGISAPDSVERGREILKSDPAAGEKAVALYESNKQISHEGIAAMRAHGERLQFDLRRIEEQFGTDSPEYNAQWEKVSDWAKRTKPMSTEAHKIFMAHQGETDVDTGSFSGLRKEHLDNTGKDFTPGQANTAKQKASKIKQATNEAILAKEKLFKNFQETKPLSDAERAAQMAVWRQHREAAIRGARAENESRLTEIARNDAVRAVQEAAKKRAQDAVNKTITGAAKRAADLENKNRVDAANKKLKEAEAERKKADLKLRKAQAEIRNAAIKAVREENKLRVAKADMPSYVKTKAAEYIKTGEENLNDIVSKLGTDLGLTNNQVRSALGKDRKFKYAADEVWRKQQKLRLLNQSAKRWLRDQQLPKLQRAFEAVPRAMFGLKVGFHGTVALGTHAPTLAFDPRYWSMYLNNFGRMYKMVGSKTFYETKVQDLLRDKNYRVARESGLVNDPYMYEDFNSPDTAKYLDFITGMGNRGYFVLKMLRQDMFNKEWNNLPKTDRIPEMAKAIANGINHETGVVQVSAPKGASVALFAPRLQMSRAMYLFGDPLKTAKTFSTWKMASEGDRYEAVRTIKQRAYVAGTLTGMLIANQGFLTATGSDQKINGIPESLGGSGFDPMKSDFLKFKVAGKNVSYGNAMVTMARLPLRMWVAIENQGKLNKIIFEDENLYKIAGDYLRSQASPFAGTAMDLATGRDFQERPLPRAGFGLLEGKTAMPKRLRAQGIEPYTWPEYLTVTALPIPAAEAMHDVWREGFGLDAEGITGMQKLMAIISALPKTAIMAGTGARISEDFDVKK